MTDQISQNLTNAAADPNAPLVNAQIPRTFFESPNGPFVGGLEGQPAEPQHPTRANALAQDVHEVVLIDSVLAARAAGRRMTQPVGERRRTGAVDHTPNTCSLARATSEMVRVVFRHSCCHRDVQGRTPRAAGAPAGAGRVN
jgi:hypothetical protein